MCTAPGNGKVYMQYFMEDIIELVKVDEFLILRINLDSKV